MGGLVLDTSAVIASILQESASVELENIMASAEQLMISTCSVLESYMVLSREGRQGQLNTFLEQLNAKKVSFSEAHAILATSAFEKFGKGRHPAGLNYGGCIVYATAKHAQLPLLFVGDDFSKTDLKVIKVQ